MDWEGLTNKLIAAIEKLIKEDKCLLEIDINERTLSGRLAFYLQKIFKDYKVDCEYNRKENDIKRLPPEESARTGDTKGKTIFPDIIIHERGNQKKNLCLIEIKKEGNNDTARDIQKLTELTDKNGGYSYDYGFHLTFGKEGLCEFQVYEDGKISPDLT